MSPQDLVHAVQVVARGEALLAPAPTRRLLERFAAPATQPTSLPDPAGGHRSPAGGKGLVQRGDCRRAVLSEATVKTCVSLLTKLCLRDRVQVPVLAYESGLVRAGERS